MSTIDTSGIDATKPVFGNPTTESVRDNFAEIILQLNNAATDIDAAVALDAVLAGMEGVTINADEIHYATGLNTYAVTTLTAFARSNILISTGGLTLTDHLILPSDNDAVTPTLSFGDGDTGFYESADDVLDIAFVGANRYQWGTNYIQGQQTNAFLLRNVTASATNPAYAINGDSDTGIGWASADQLSLIAGGVEMLRLVETGVATTDQIIIGPAGIIGTAGTPALAFGDGDTGFYEQIDDVIYVACGGISYWQMTASYLGMPGAGPTFRHRAPTATIPSFIPIGTDDDTGIGWTSADRMSLIAGGVSQMEIYENTGVGQVILPLQDLAATPTLAFGDGDTGVYEGNDDVLSVSTGGQERYRFSIANFYATTSNSFSLDWSASTSTNPAYAFNGDQDTGVGSAGADQLSLITGGVEAMRIDAAGNVAIGLTTIEPWDASAFVLEVGGKTNLFELFGSSYLANNAYYNAAWLYQESLAAAYHRVSSGSHIFAVAAAGVADAAISWTTALTIDNAGDATFGGWVKLVDGEPLYLGTGNDIQIAHAGGTSQILNLTGTLNILEAVDSGNIQIQTQDSVSAQNTTAVFGGANSAASFYYSGDLKFTTTNDGVDISGGVNLLEKAAAATNRATYGEIWVRSDAPNTLMFTDDDGTDYEVAGSTVTNSPWTINGNDIHYDTGYIGVGETPNAGWAFYDAIQFGDAAAISGDSNYTNITANLYAYGNNSWRRSTANLANIYQQAAGSHYFYTAISSTAGSIATPLLQLKLDSAKNVGFAFTPRSNQVSTHTHVSVGGNAQIWATEAVGVSSELIIGQNVYEYSTPQDRYINTDQASKYTQVDGTHVFEVAVSGTTETAITWTTALTIGNAGTAYFAEGLGVGSLPAAGSMFEINQTIEGATTSRGAYVSAVAQSDATLAVAGFETLIGTQATAYTLTSLIHFKADEGTLGAGSTITRQYGFRAEEMTNASTANYAFYGNNAAASTSFNLYMAGSAVNYLAGELRLASGLIMFDAASVPLSPIAGRGQIWVRNDTPDTLMFTDDAGTDFEVAGSTVSASPWTTVGNDIYYDTGDISVGRTTFEAWGAAYSVIQIGGQSSIVADTAAGINKQLILNQNAYYDTGWKYSETDEASQYYQDRGKHTFRVAVSGTLDTAITWTTGLIVNNDGTVTADGVTIKGDTVNSSAISISNGGGAIADDIYALAMVHTAEAHGQHSIAIGFLADSKEDYGISIGYGAITGNNDGLNAEQDAIAIGHNAKAYERSGIAIGANTVTGISGGAADDGGIAIGSGATANDIQTVAIGYISDANGVYGVGIGSNAQARGNYAVAIGYLSQAGQVAGVGENDATAIGADSKAYEEGCIAIGGGEAGLTGFSASPHAIAIGDASFATQTYSIALGYASEARATQAVAIGRESDARETNTISIGYQSQAGQTDGATAEQFAIAIGNSADAYETNGVSIGQSAVTGKSGTSLDPNGVAIGAQASAIEEDAVALGYSSLAGGTDAISISNSTAYEAGSIAIGVNAIAGQTLNSSAEFGAIALGSSARAYNYGSVAIAANATAGTNDINNEDYAIAIGWLSNATKLETIAIGHNSEGREDYAIAIGFGAQAFETDGIAIGRAAQSGTTTGGVTEINSIAIGNGAEARNRGSIALGAGTINIVDNQFMAGSSTEAISTVLFGNGLSSATPAGFLLKTTYASGTNVAGTNVTIAAGQSTGNLDGGDLIFQVSPLGGAGSALNSLVTSLTLAGDRTAYFSGATFAASNGNGPVLMNETAGAGNPTLVPDQSDPDTGVGQSAVDTLHLITNATNALEITATQNAILRAGVMYFTEQAAKDTVDAAAGLSHLYVKSTGAGELFFVDDGGAETLVASASGTAVAGDLVLIEEQVISGTPTEVDFETFIDDAEYTDYYFRLTNVQPTTDDVDIRMRVGTGVTPTYQTGTVYENSGATFMAVALGQGNGAVESYSGYIDLLSPSDTTYWTKIKGDGVRIQASTGNSAGSTLSGDYSAATAVTAIRFFLESGTFANGTITLYGIKK